MFSKFLIIGQWCCGGGGISKRKRWINKKMSVEYVYSCLPFDNTGSTKSADVYPEYFASSTCQVSAITRQSDIRGSQPLRTPEGSQPLRTPEGLQPIRTPEGSQPLRTPEGSHPLRTPEGSQPLRTPECRHRDVKRRESIIDSCTVLKLIEHIYLYCPHHKISKVCICNY